MKVILVFLLGFVTSAAPQIGLTLSGITLFIFGVYDIWIDKHSKTYAAGINRKQLTTKGKNTYHLNGTRLRVEVVMDPISIKEGLPEPDDLEPKTHYCWWFNVSSDTWLYGDASTLGHPWCYWLPYYVRPIPPGSWIDL